ncbi:hypothetical protein [Sporomusa aerivorans]|uniref:DUF7446 family protein n=1 Tax=Sporomusa aerivorans TaxID=204936 RepID=UPI00352A5772
MAKLDKLQIWVSPLTNTIYAGYAREGVATEKVAITQQAIDAVGAHLMKTGDKYESDYGQLIFVSKGEGNEKS